MANNRLQELDKLHQQHRDALKEVEKLKMDVSDESLFLCFYFVRTIISGKLVFIFLHTY